MILARLLSATPQTDGEHWDLSFRWHFDVWHTDLYAQNPAPYQRNPQLGNPGRPPYPWRPGFAVWGAVSYIHPVSGSGSDALFDGAYGFQVAINTANSPATLDIAGNIPINQQAAGFAPQCPLYATVSTTGGLIPSGSYLISIAASQLGPVSTYAIQAVIPAGTTTGSIVISGVVWQAAAPSIGLYAGTSSLTMHSIVSGDWVGSSPDTYGNPTVFTIERIDFDGFGMPDPLFNSFQFQAKEIIHGGVWRDVATSAGSTGGIHPNGTVTNPAWSWGVNQWAGYVLSRYDAGTGSAMNFDVASNTATTIEVFGHGPPAGVMLVMRANADSITASTIGDANFVNAQSPAGLAVNVEVGNLIRIIAGTGAGQAPISILSNTATVFTIAGTWSMTPDASSVWIVEASTWKYSVPSATIVNGQAVTGGFRSAVPIVGSIPIVNFQGGNLLIEVITVDVDGNWSVERYAPIREIFVPAVSLPAANSGVTRNGVAVTY